MMRGSRLLLKDAGSISKALSDFLVCPLSKQPLRHFEDSQSLISETIGVSFPIIDGIPCLGPKDGKLLEDQDKSQIENDADPSCVNRKRYLSIFLLSCQCLMMLLKKISRFMVVHLFVVLLLVFLYVCVYLSEILEHLIWNSYSL